MIPKKLDHIKRKILSILAVAIILFTIILIIKKSILLASLTAISSFILIFGYSLMRVKLEEYQNIKKMEIAFPDFLQLVASNLRAGMTTDLALLTSARKEFDPLDKEIGKMGKELMTGKDIESALLDLGRRINSVKIKRTISLIVSGIRSGGNIAILLEETASNTREREFIQKRAASNVLMYVIFIFAAITIGAPGLFGLSTVLVDVLTSILSGIPEVQAGVNLPFTLTKIDLPAGFILYFSLIFICAINIIGSLVLGLVMKGEEKEGTRYMIPVLAASISIFFGVRIILLKYFSQFFNN
ncbi:MAG: type II secretion system F family protein [Candidatus Pacearchaeota archaeon]